MKHSLIDYVPKMRSKELIDLEIKQQSRVPVPKPQPGKNRKELISKIYKTNYKKIINFRKGYYHPQLFLHLLNLGILKYFSWKQKKHLLKKM